MPGRITERELLIPALQAAAAKANGEITTDALVAELVSQFRPEGDDAEILEGRADTTFTEKVRNIVARRGGWKTMFSKGYAVYTGKGFRITDAGRALLEQIPE